MFETIIVALDSSPESKRAFASAIRLTLVLGSELHAVTICESSPVSASSVRAVAPTLVQTLVSDQKDYAAQRLAEARVMAGRHGIDLTTHLVEGHAVDSIISCANNCKADLLVLGIHQQSLYVARLWSSASQLALDSPCCVLGVN